MTEAGDAAGCRRLVGSLVGVVETALRRLDPRVLAGEQFDLVLKLRADMAERAAGLLVVEAEQRARLTERLHDLAEREGDLVASCHRILAAIEGEGRR